MAQRGQLAWSELRVGIFVLLGIVLVLAGIFYVTGGGLLGAKYRLVTYRPEVEGLAVGAPVSLDGVEVGNVDAIQVANLPPSGQEDKQRSIEVVLRISRKFQDYIRSDSTVSLITQGFLGDRTVTLQRGYTGMVLRDGQEVKSVEEKGLKQMMERGADLMQNLNGLTSQLNDVMTKIRQGNGTVGKLLSDDTAYNHLNNTLDRLDQISASIQRGQGTIGKLVSSDELYGKVDSAVSRVDDVLAAVQTQKGSLGKLVYDPAIHDSAERLLDNGNALIAGARAGQGTLGKLVTDDTLYTVMRDTGQNLKEATAKLNSNQNTAGKLLSDPKLYDNLTGLTGDMRLLLGEFRQNPKKFLHVRFSIF